MKHKIKIIILASVILSTGFVWDVIYSQEITPLSRLAQEYILRTTTEVKEALLQESVNNESTDTKDQNTVTENTQLKEEELKNITNSIVVDPERITRNAVTESIDTITRTTEQITVEKKQVIEDIKTSIKEDIDKSIIEIRKQTDKPAYELQNVIDQERVQLFETITRKVEEINPVQIKQSTDLKQVVDTSIRTIQEKLEEQAPQVTLDFDQSLTKTRQTINDFETKLKQKRDLIETREGALIYLDSDNDGISDYDEMYIYKTNPDNAFTVLGELNDGEKISKGINPLSEAMERKQYQDPRDDREAFVSEVYKVNKVQLVKEENQKSKIALEGIALPNSFITLFIFSTPIIVTVQTDSSGRWTYNLEQELENGEHQVFVTTVDASGKIVARSNPILFTKTADAASIGIAGSLNAQVSTQNFLKDNFVLIIIALLITTTIIGMMFIGNHRNIRSAVLDLRNEVNSKP